MTEKPKQSDPKLQIAGDLTVADWCNFREKLKNENTPENWRKAYEDYFLMRIQTRYFDPIETLIKQNDKAGEGFSIVALQCSLIEFLASTVEGKTYKHEPATKCDKCDKKCLPIEEANSEHYYSSVKLFTNFLCTAIPFKKHFTSKTKANDFYENVRCAILHDARTKGEWKIRASNEDNLGKEDNKFIDYSEKIIYRNNLQSAFKEFVEDYGEKLPQCKKLQEGFKSKFNYLCKE